jgi:hypothetical protein
VVELRVDPQTVLSVVTFYYLNLNDFNGISAGELVETFNVDWPALCSPLQGLIAEGKVGALFADAEHNTHIIRVGFEAQEVQIGKLPTADLFHTCLYPRPPHLMEVVDRDKYATEPYKLCLALGEPQLDYRIFDLSVLADYRDDPRYCYSTDDIRGQIYIKTESYESPRFLERDRILLETFGFADDADFNRAVAVFLRYLAALTPEHQWKWKGQEIKDKHRYRIHPEYYRTDLVGDMPEAYSIFTTFLTELALINRMANAMGRPRLFRDDFTEKCPSKPRRFGSLLRSTREEFDRFVLMLYQLLPDNINHKFFADVVPSEYEEVRKDGKIVVKKKGTLQLLNDWVTHALGNADSDAWQSVYKTLKMVRELRNGPVHTITDDVCNPHYFQEQRVLIVEAYIAVRTLRELLGTHPSVMAANIRVPTWLQERRISII